MIIVKLMGGLGNQMFQYAFGRALSIKHNQKLILDIDEFSTCESRDFELNKYNISGKIFTRKEKTNLKILNPKSLFFKLLKKLNLTSLIPNYYLEKTLVYHEDILTLDNMYFDGYFQNEKYFKSIRNELLNDFKITEDITAYTKEVKKLIKSSDKSVSLHIRRGDYVSNSRINNIHGTCSLEYYTKAIEYIKTQIGEINIFIFSDDISWVKENLHHKNIYFVESYNNRIPHEDIYLMSLCSHHIIANSSFSWWGAWLNQNENKIVIAPKRWFNDKKMEKQAQDIVPRDWIRI